MILNSARKATYALAVLPRPGGIDSPDVTGTGLIPKVKCTRDELLCPTLIGVKKAVSSLNEMNRQLVVYQSKFASSRRPCMGSLQSTEFVARGAIFS